MTHDPIEPQYVPENPPQYPAYYGAPPTYGTPPSYGYPPQYQGQPWAAPPYPPYYQPVRATTNGYAIASMVLGILWVFWIGSVLAVIFGVIARRQINQRHEAGEGMAVAGLVLGILGVCLLVIPNVAFAIAAVV
ncbi:MAG TPA: DUF4190 domain-containing protein [Jatrophihabitantaceae bacterium]|jgi:hypothetical protein|nr:DUF4190 domain-containing protein [Jatrophihabitantaceae bacterium]